MCELTDETGASSDVAAAEEENDDDDNGSDADDDVEFNDESIGELMNAFDKMGMGLLYQHQRLLRAHFTRILASHCILLMRFVFVFRGVMCTQA